MIDQSNARYARPARHDCRDLLPTERSICGRHDLVASIELRRAVIADIPAIEELYYPYSHRHINVPRVSDALVNYPSVTAWNDQKLVGFLYCFRFSPDILELANIYIDQQTRHAGLGSKMITFLRSHLSEQIKAIIAVNSDLHPVTDLKRRPDSFYFKNGFRLLASTNNSVVYWWERG